MQGNQLIGRGRTADVFSWKDDRVLKLYYTFIPARVVEQEFRATRAAAAAGLPVPAADELVEVEGRHGIIFERVHGPSMLRLFSLQPWRMGELARLLAELHAHVHAVAAPEGLPAQHPRIADGIRAGKGLTEPEKDAALARLAGLPVGDRLCHGDFHPDNILMTARGPMIID